MAVPAGRVRKSGGGRKKKSSRDPTLAADLKRLVEPVTRGDPMQPLLWTTRSLRNLVTELAKEGHKVCPTVVSELLRGMGYSLQANNKTREGGQHIDRDAQFQYINTQATTFLAANEPTGQVRSVINRFALVAAALRMAIEAGMLPWSIDDADLGVAACLVRWAANRKGRLNLAGEMVSAVEKIRGALTANLQGRFIHLQRNEDGELEYANPSDETKRETLGFVKNGRILVEPTAWRTELCAGFDPEKTARHLRDEGLLATDPGKLQRQHKILRGGLVEKGRFYDLDMKILEDMAGTGPDEKGA